MSGPSSPRRRAATAIVSLAVLVLAAACSRSSRDITDAAPVETRPTTSFRAPAIASDPVAGDDEPVQPTFAACAPVAQPFPFPPRTCRIVTPSDTGTDERLPVVILLHGWNTAPETVLANGAWEAALDEHRFMVVLPQGQYGGWNAGGCCGPSQGAGVDDVGYLRAVVDQLVARFDVDPARIAVVGESNGGMMAYRYGCVDERVAAIASVEGTPVSDCPSPRPRPVLHVHGRDDLTVPYAGGQSLASWVLGVTFPALGPAIGRVAAAMGCGGQPAVTTDATVTVDAWQGCPPGARVELVSLAGVGHVWPRGEPYDATAEIVEFLGYA